MERLSLVEGCSQPSATQLGKSQENKYSTELPFHFSHLLMAPPIRHTQPEARRQGAILMLSTEIRPLGGTELIAEGGI